MLGWLVLAGALALAWRISFWPFDRSYKYIPKYGDTQHDKCGPTTPHKPAE